MPSHTWWKSCFAIIKSHVYFHFVRYDKLPSVNAYIDLRSWWIKITKKKNYRKVWAPKFPTVEEVRQVKNETWEREGILQFEREVTSIRAIQSSVQINENWYPRNQTCLLILKKPIAETAQELEEILKDIAAKGAFIFEFRIFGNFLFCF